MKTTRDQSSFISQSRYTFVHFDLKLIYQTRETLFKTFLKKGEGENTARRVS